MNSRFSQVLGFVNFCIGVALLLVWPFAHMLILLNSSIGDDPVSYVMSNNVPYSLWTKASHILALPMTLLLVVSGLSSPLKKSLSRRAGRARAKGVRRRGG